MRAQTLFAAAVLAAAGAAVAGCTHLSQEQADAAVTRSLQEDDAYREAQRRCAGAPIRQSEGSSGTYPSDYVCQGH
jgi:hypothetical protein